MEELLRRRTEEVGLLRLQLDTLSTTDGITGLLNRNGIVDAIETALQRLHRFGEPFAVICVVLPVLREVLGAHPAETEDVLRHVAALLRAALRQLDRVGRLDETTFLAVMSAVGTTTYEAPLRRLRSILQALPIAAGGRRYEPEPRFAVVLVERPGAPCAQEVLSLVRRAISEATVDGPAVLRVEPPP